VLLHAFWTRLGLDVLLGSVSGGVTSWVAVVMIFRPYERTFGFHGAVPKNKARLAKTIGKTVGERLLTPADILAELQQSGLREGIEAKLREVAHDALETEHGSLRAMLPSPVLGEIERTLVDAGPGAGEAYARYVASAAFETQVRAFVEKSGNEVAVVESGNALAVERKTGIAARASGIAAGLVNDMIVKWALRAARSDRARAMAADAVSGGVTSLLDKPIGRLSRWVPQDATERVVEAAAPAVWEQIIEKLPALLETVDIPAMVERKVLGFSTQRVEEIVRGVTQRELTLIVQLGYVLGGLIGVVQFAFEWGLRG
jgi:uncharacterized membrane protein YheB (UPF0754 family)